MHTPVPSTRRERDFFGEHDIPVAAYWGVHTARALENFPISGVSVGRLPELVRALAFVKKAAVQANLMLGVTDGLRSDAIVRACDDLIGGALHEQFVVDVIQGGAGAATNMNANEVIANRALEHLGRPKGDYEVLHPDVHVNASQSTHDVYPTALRVATWFGMEALRTALTDLRMAFEAKALDFQAVLKVGRTQLQDAGPMTLGQEFRAFALLIGEDEERLCEARALMAEVNLGAAVLGTGRVVPAGYAELVVPLLARLTGVPLVRAAHLADAPQDTGVFVQLSGVLKRVACKLSKVSNDLRLLSSGPQAGFGDIHLPPRQAGAAFLPAQGSPVIPEVMNQVAFEVIGNDMTLTMACEAGQLQLNAFEPLIAYTLHNSLKHLTQACKTLQRNCVQGIQANEALLKQRVAESVTLVSVLTPELGADKAALVAQTALASGSTLAQAAELLGFMTQAEMGALLVPQALTRPAQRGGPA